MTNETRHVEKKAYRKGGILKTESDKVKSEKCTRFIRFRYQIIRLEKYVREM